MDPKQALTLRTKKLGVLLKDARIASGKSLRDCGEVIGVSGGTMSSYEHGVKAPSLPELEVLAYYLGIPIDHFWSEEIRSNEPHPTEELETGQILSLRHRVIGALIRQARKETNQTLRDLAQRTGIPSGRLKIYESGERPIPLPELEILAKGLGITLADFSDNQGPISEWLIQQRAIKQFLQLPMPLMEFISKPVNRPYLELAQRLSSMSVDQLRRVAEGLLEITL